MSSETTGPSNDTSGDEGHPSRPGTLLQRRPILFALAFQVGLTLFAVVLALIFGLRPWLTIAFDSAGLMQSLLATAPLVVAVLALMRVRWQWVENLQRIVREHLLPLFRDTGRLAVFAVALMAGISEELLFRGVLQAGLANLAGPIPALAAASLLFGLAHAVSPAYFILTFLIGGYLGWLYQATGNLLLPIMVHFLFDWIVLSWYLSGSRQQS